MDLDAVLECFGLQIPVAAASDVASDTEGDAEGDAASASGLDVRDVREVGEANAGAAAPHAEAEQIVGLCEIAVIGEPLPKRAKFNQRSVAHVQNARQCQQIRRAQLCAQVQTQKAISSEASLQTVTSLLPGVASIVGQVGGKPIGRKRPEHLNPNDFKVLVRALHLSPATDIRLGISLRRLICIAARFIEARQQRALQSLLCSSKLALAHATRGAPRIVHLAFCHMWDEVQVKFASRGFRKARSDKAATLTQTMVQRGSLSFALVDLSRASAAAFAEYWLSTPVEVQGTDAASIFPAIARAIPVGLSVHDEQAMDDLMASCSSMTFQPMCDKASGNLVLLR